MQYATIKFLNFASKYGVLKAGNCREFKQENDAKHTSELFWEGNK